LGTRKSCVTATAAKSRQSTSPSISWYVKNNL
jgi:hypothetical protein